MQRAYERSPLCQSCSQGHADKAVQVNFDGQTVADLRAASPPPSPPGAPPATAATASYTPLSPLTPPPLGKSLAARMAMMNAIVRMVGIHVLVRRRLLEQQLEQLSRLRADVIAKFETKAVKDSLLELRKYRRPPRVAAQVRA